MLHLASWGHCSKKHSPLRVGISAFYTSKNFWRKTVCYIILQRLRFNFFLKRSKSNNASFLEQQLKSYDETDFAKPTICGEAEIRTGQLGGKNRRLDLRLYQSPNLSLRKRISTPKQVGVILQDRIDQYSRKIEVQKCVSGKRFSA